MWSLKNKLRTSLPRALMLAALGTALSGLSGGIAEATANTVEPPASEPPASVSICTPGEFCAWLEKSFAGLDKRLDLRIANPGECIPLGEAFEAKSFVNRMDREITVYQGSDCSTEGDFTTYPGYGTYVPQAKFVVRAIQIWE